MVRDHGNRFISLRTRQLAATDWSLEAAAVYQDSTQAPQGTKGNAGALQSGNAAVTRNSGPTTDRLGDAAHMRHP
jgi:hypothetical protein